MDGTERGRGGFLSEHEVSEENRIPPSPISKLVTEQPVM